MSTTKKTPAKIGLYGYGIGATRNRVVSVNSNIDLRSHGSMSYLLSPCGTRLLNKPLYLVGQREMSVFHAVY